MLNPGCGRGHDDYVCLSKFIDLDTLNKGVLGGI